MYDHMSIARAEPARERRHPLIKLSYQLRLAIIAASVYYCRRIIASIHRVSMIRAAFAYQTRNSPN